MPPQIPRPEPPPGRYDVFSFDVTEGRIYSCLSCSEDLKEGDPIYVDPSTGSDGYEWMTVVSYWHAHCWDAAEEYLDKLEGK